MLLAALICFASPLPADALVEEGHEFVSLPSLADASGGMFGFSDIRGAHTLFVFFSIYSDGTLDLIESVSGLHNSSSFDSPFQVVGVSVDPSAKAVSSFISKKKIPFRVLADASLSFSNKFGVAETPAMVLLSPDGEVLFSQKSGSIGDKKHFQKKLASIISDAPRPSPAADKSAALDEKYKDKKLISPDAKMVAVCPANKSSILYIAPDNTLMVFDFISGKLSKQATDATSASWTPDGKSILYATGDSGIWKKSLKGEAKKISPEGRNPVYSSSDDMAAFIVNENEIWVAKLSTGKRWKVAANGVNVEWTADGNLLIVTDSKGKVWLVSPYSRASLVKSIFK